MATTTLDGHTVHVDDEGFLTEYDEWDEDLAKVLAAQIGIDLTDAHWRVLRFLREDFKSQGETPTTRRVGSKPHDHGPSWAIYGQAAGETIMTDWDCLARPTEATPGKAKHVRDYTMKVGDAYLYDTGVLHSPRREGSTRLLRIEGKNMERVKRFPYEAVDALSPAAE